MTEFEEARAVFDQIWEDSRIRHILEQSYESQNWKIPGPFMQLLGEPVPPRPERHVMKSYFEQRLDYSIRLGLENAEKVRAGKSAQDVYQPSYRFTHGREGSFIELYVNRNGPPTKFGPLSKEEFLGWMFDKRKAYLRSIGLDPDKVRQEN